MDGPEEGCCGNISDGSGERRVRPCLRASRLVFSNVGTVLFALALATQEAEQLALNDPQSSGRKGRLQ